ncbi:class I SAM-dependent methyltransferase [Chitiniphilus purpureus]|uniref:Class I SAM-dependent methyltransferase n=1 Tax=Chitiniphilus purpureus TaxID=2981137 RepID=A0ABY6DK61_9NEIS|nr:class I SAM-dependent methyltransferase [Chitiniphilus sp. CD1]UXY14078.1 class I SAM-dependent methyltransferase [Chitiniphilus sp. CD1]
MHHPPSRNDAQIAQWNGAAGHAWRDEHALLDRMFKPFEDLIAATPGVGPGSVVLDVGCGTGATVMALARRVGQAGRVLGIDVSAPMLDVARARAQPGDGQVHFVQADAQTYPFAPAGFDAVVSRFGVMFFSDPVRAFTNLRYAVRPAGALRCLAWRSAGDNPFMVEAERAAAHLLAGLAQARPDGPGQFAFAERRHVEDLLAASGWTRVAVQPVDAVCAFPETALPRYLTRLGPVGRLLADKDEAARQQIVAALRPAFDRYLHDGEVRFSAACWLIEARAPG